MSVPLADTPPEHAQMVTGPKHPGRFARRHCLRGGLALAAGLAGLGGLPASQARMATPAEIAAELPDASLRGSATLRFMGLHVYDLRLWSPQALQGEGIDQPLALELQYARQLKGRSIAERSIEEMGRIGEFSASQAEAWLAALTTMFPNVAPQDRLTGVHRPGQGARFFFNGQKRGELADAQFARLFFGIWLSPKTSEPSLRRQLLSGGKG